MESANPLPSGSALVERAELALTLGRMLFRFGASTQRIIDSMEMLHARLGGERLEVMATYDAITVMASENGRSCTRVSSSREMAGVNIHGLSEIRRLLADEDSDWSSARVCARLEEIANAPELARGWPWQWLAAGAVSAGFCAFNGGDLPAVGIAALASLAIFTVRLLLLRRRFTIYLSTFGSVCAGGVVTAAAMPLLASATPEVALVAPVLFLVPGVPMITGGIDVTRNHNSVGLARIAYTLALTATIVLGLALSLPLLIDLPPLHAAAAPQAWTKPFVDAAWGALAAGGLAFLNKGRWRALGVCALCGAAARLMREGGVELGVNISGATLLGAVAATLIAIRLGGRQGMPSAIIAVMGCLTLIPGFYAISGVRGLFQLSVQGGKMPWPDAVYGLQMTLQAIFIAFAIIVGIIFTIMAVERDARRV